MYTLDNEKEELICPPEEMKFWVDKLPYLIIIITHQRRCMIKYISPQKT